MRFVICLIIFSLFTSAKVGDDSLSIKIKQAAKYKTDSQIDSVYRVVDIRPVVDALKNNFGVLRNHMDSLNMLILVNQMQLAKESELRDNTLAEMQMVSLENDRLRADNEEKHKQIYIISQGTHILMALASIMGIVYFGIGIGNYLRGEKHNE